MLKLPREMQRPAGCRREARRTRAQQRCGQSRNLRRTEASFGGEHRGEPARSPAPSSLEPLLTLSPDGCWSGRLTRVEMMQTAHLRELDYWSLFRSHHRPWSRTVMRQRPRGTGKVVVVEVVFQNALKVSFSDDDHLIQTFPTDGLDRSFDVRILPRRTRRSGLFLDPEARHALGELRPFSGF